MNPLCNLCGEPCACTHYPKLGLIEAKVEGAYFSTPGNGCGALDDMTGYKFSLCEFCLDWLFAHFWFPPVVTHHGDLETFRPAAQRVLEDEWRTKKKEFFVEAERRTKLRRRAFAANVDKLHKLVYR